MLRNKLTSWSLMALSCSSFLAQYLASSSGMSAARNTNTTYFSIGCTQHFVRRIRLKMNQMLGSVAPVAAKALSNKTKPSCTNYAKEVKPSGSSKRVSSSSRWKVGSLVPHTSFSAMIALESKVTHWPGPSWKTWNSLIDALTTLWMEVEEGAGTSLDCRMLRSGIHKVPTMVSQISPLFHTSTVKPRSRRFISLHGEEMVD